MGKLTQSLIVRRSSTFDPEATHLLSLSGEALTAIDPVINKCINLRELNLSKNNISSLGGFDGAKVVCLATLVLTHNQIKSVAGLSSLPSLLHLHLQGNQVSAVHELKDLAKKLPSLKALHFQEADGSHANPICSQPDYADSVRAHFPFLQVMDGKILRENSELYAPVPPMEDDDDMTKYVKPQEDWLAKYNSDNEDEDEEADMAVGETYNRFSDANKQWKETEQEAKTMINDARAAAQSSNGKAK